MSSRGRQVVEGAMRAFRRVFHLKPSTQRVVLGVLFGTCMPLAMVVACNDDPQKAPIVGGGNLAGGPGIPDPCAVPSEGCACDSEGAMLECGTTAERHDDYVTCRMGTRTCTDGQWTACETERVTLKSTSTGSPGLRQSTPGMQQACVNDAGVEFDPCDPYCNVTPETSDTVDAGPNFTNDGGLSVTPTVIMTTPCTQLSVAPTNATAPGGIVTVTGFGPPPVTTPTGPVRFTVTYGPSNCSTPATFPMTWTIDQVDRAQISGTTNMDGQLTVAVPLGGPIQVTVYAFGISATTTVNVKVNVLDAPTTSTAATPNVPATSGQRSAFGAWNTPATGTINSTAVWLYPYADTYFPLALPPPQIQYWYTNVNNATGWNDGASTNRAVKVSLRYPVNTSSNPSSGTYSDFNYSLVVSEANVVSQSAGRPSDTRDPQVVIPAVAWQYFEQTARGNFADVLVQRIAGSTLERESRRRIYFVDGQLKGTVYYNSYTSPLAGNTGAVLRISPGATAPTVAVQPTSDGTASGTRKCTVCHSLNQNGTQLIANTDRTGMNPNVTGGVTFNNSQRYDTTNPLVAPYSVPVLQTYASTSGDSNNVPGDRYTFGGPRTDGALYMTHGGTSGSGDANWRAPPAVSRLFSVTDATNPIALTGWPTNVQAITPRFSPAGDKLAFGFWAGSNLPTSPTGGLAPASGGTRLVVMDFACNAPPCSGTGEGVTNARDLTPGVTHRVAWPSFLPDGSAVIYQRQYRTSQSRGSGQTPDGVLNNGWSPSHINTVAGALAELWLSVIPANRSTAAVPTQLRALNGLNAAGTASYLPEDTRAAGTFTPTYHQNAGATFTISQADNCSNTGSAANTKDTQLNYLPAVSPVKAGGFSWVVFTSRRMYGSVARNDPWDAEPTFPSCYSGDPATKKLWIAAIDGTVTPGTDPSHPAFYFPGQELKAGNSDGYWVNSACVDLDGACSSDDDCCLATGANPTRECRVTSSSTVPPTKLCKNRSSCSMIGGACNATTPCCSGMCPAGGGVCVLEPPPPMMTYMQQTLTRDFTATCPRGTQPKWRFFEWQATVPTGASIDFSVQVKQTSGSYAPSTPLLVNTATPATGTGPGVWYGGLISASNKTVDEVLNTASLASSPEIRITMTFKPNAMAVPPAAASPTLHEWRQIFDCMPAE